MKKKIKFINLVGQYQSISGDMKKQFGKIFSNSSFVLREHVSRFEKQISRKLKVKKENRHLDAVHNNRG